jgi:hypothetical protein
LREYELKLPVSNRGPDVGRVYFVILEMSRKPFFISVAVSVKAYAIHCYVHTIVSLKFENSIL